jgi:hypothetical protein
MFLPFALEIDVNIENSMDSNEKVLECVQQELKLKLQ